MPYLFLKACQPFVLAGFFLGSFVDADGLHPSLMNITPSGLGLIGSKFRH